MREVDTTTVTIRMKLYNIDDVVASITERLECPSTVDAEYEDIEVESVVVGDWPPMPNPCLKCGDEIPYVSANQPVKVEAFCGRCAGEPSEPKE